MTKTKQNINTKHKLVVRTKKVPHQVLFHHFDINDIT